MPIWTNLDNDIPKEELNQVGMDNFTGISGAPGVFITKHADTGSILIQLNQAALTMYEFTTTNNFTSVKKFQDFNFLDAGKGSSKNSTLPSFGAQYILIEPTPTITYKTNNGGATVPSYIRNQTFFIVGIQLATVNAVTGTFVRIIRSDRSSPSYINQYFVPFSIRAFSGYVTSKGDSIELVALVSSSAYRMIITFNDTSSYKFGPVFSNAESLSNDVCCLDQSEILLYSTTKNDFVVYDQKGTFVRDSKATVAAPNYRFRKEPVGCSVTYSNSMGKEFIAMAYPLSNLNFTNPLFLPSELTGVFFQELKSTYTSVDGQIFFADPSGRISLVYLRQNVTTMPTVQNTTDLIFQTTNYSMSPRAFNFPTKQQFFLFRNMSMSDRFYVLSRDTLGSMGAPNLDRIYTKPLALNCKNPTFTDKQNSKEYYYKIGAFSNPDARREKQLMMIIRKDSLTKSFTGAVKSPITWVAAVLSAISIGLALFLMIKITLQLKSATAVGNSKVVRRPDPASESLIVRQPGGPISLASINKL